MPRAAWEVGSDKLTVSPFCFAVSGETISLSSPPSPRAFGKEKREKKAKIQSGQETMSEVRDINSIRAAMIRGNEMAIEVAD